MEENYDVAGLPSSILRELTTRCSKKGFDFQEPGNPLVVNEIERLRVSYERKKLRSKTASAARRKKVKALLAGVSASADTKLALRAPAPALVPAKQQAGTAVVAPVADTAAMPAQTRQDVACCEATKDTTPIEEVVAAADTTVSTSADRPVQQADVQPTTTWQPPPRRQMQQADVPARSATATWQTRPTRQRQAHAPRAPARGAATGLIRRRF
jgi:hypothetical protein